MDSFADLPPVDAQPADPTPPSFSNGTHTPYSQMIIAAIGALKDKDGSSRQAIAKYIEKEYSDLPPSHSNLLTHHLKRMKNEGQLMMVKHSYMLPTPRSVPFESPGPTMDHLISDYSVTGTDTANFRPENSSLVRRRKPGRPPKPRHDFGFQVQPDVQLEAQIQPPLEIQPYQPQFDQHTATGQDFQSQPHLDASGQDVQSHYGSGQEFEGNYAGGGGGGASASAEPMFVSLGLADDSVVQHPPLETPVVSTKRGRGRPPKSSTVTKSVVTGSGGGGGGSNVDFSGDHEEGKRENRRKPGRPKLMSISMVNGGGVKRGIGRPKRIGGPVTVPLSGNVMSPRGRPKRAVSMKNASVNVNGDGGPVSGRRGRPPKRYGSANKDGPGTAVLVTDPHQLVAYQELKFKYEHLQLKAKEALSVVRPYINPDYAAFGAVQELERLAEAP